MERSNKMHAAGRPAYSLTVDLAAELLNVSVQRIEHLISQGVIRTKTRNGTTKVSALDVEGLKKPEPRPKSCPTAELMQTPEGRSAVRRLTKTLKRSR